MSGVYFLMQPVLLLFYVFAAFLVVFTLKRKSFEKQLESKLGVKNPALFGFGICLLIVGSGASILYPYQILSWVLAFLGIIFTSSSFYYSPMLTESAEINVLAVFGGALLLAGLAFSLIYAYQGFGVVLFVTGIFVSAVAFLNPQTETKLKVKNMRLCPMCNYEINDEKAEFCPRCGEALPKDELKIIETTKLRFVGGALILAGILAFIMNNGIYYLGLLSIPLVILMLFVLNTTALRRKHLWTMIACEIAIVVELIFVWQVVSQFLYLSETHNFGDIYGLYLNGLGWAVIPFAITIVGTVAMALAKKEFKD
jgi:predicted nucleic acid-binding Zn ribbon protein